MEVSDCAASLWYLQGPSVISQASTLFPGDVMCGLAALQGNLIFTLTVTELPRDWMGVKASSRFEQISAVIFVCVCVWSHC